ncbi:MAG: AAA family ATPase [Candidatus Competibacteraceae bacterium]|nr:AAA family ATPase [Candidatus Competibacteraceae bacterium]
MGVVVLTGFSCTGKSTFVNTLQADPALAHVQFVDTDQLIAQSAGGHIYQVFLNHVQGANRQAALAFIEKEELGFLQNFQPQKHCVIAAGPILPTRSPDFANFLARTNATCVWLSISAATAVQRLLSRQNTLAGSNPKVAAHKAFGSWNAPHLMEFDPVQGIYVPRSSADQLASASTILSNCERVYQGFAGGRAHRHFVEDEDRKKAAEARIRSLALK